MISEKTVELNLTLELINWASWQTRRTHFALAPSQLQEGLMGFDTSIQVNGTGILILYKPAIVSGSHWQWHLNRTKMRDQHLRLQTLESCGIPVLYAFPFFHTPLEIGINRWSLLKNTFWSLPSQINPPGGATGFHDVHFDSSTRRWWVTSEEEEVDLFPPEGPKMFIQLLHSENNEDNLSRLFKDFNRVINEGIDKVSPEIKIEDHFGGLVQGISAIIQVSKGEEIGLDVDQESSRRSMQGGSLAGIGANNAD